MKLDAYTNEIIKEVEDITDIDYRREIGENDMITADLLFDMVVELLKKNYDTKKQLEELQEDVDENYIFNNKNKYNEYGLGKDF